MDAFEDPRITAFGLLTEVHNGLSLRFTEHHSSIEMSGPEFNVLIRLVRSPDQRLRMTDLAAQTTLSTSGVTRLVDRLEQRGLLARQPCATDRRSSYAAITAAGIAVVTELAAENVKVIDRWFTGLLTPEQLDTFLTTLRVIRDEVHPGATAGA